MLDQWPQTADDSYARMCEGLQPLWQVGEHVIGRAQRTIGDDGATVLVAWLDSERSSAASLHGFVHEFALKGDLDGAWALRPLALVHEGGKTMLVREDPGGEPLGQLIGTPMRVDEVVRIAIGIATALGRLHQRGLVHRDLTPDHVFVNCTDGQPRLTGFGIASLLRRERQAPAPPEALAGTLAYMAPEQTGRMNRSIDARSDLYALGVTLYQMLTGVLPFAAADPMEWVHCHIARRPIPPSEQVAAVPGVLSAIVMKLMAKTAEERYQTAGGVERDLRRCLHAWEAHGCIDDFALGQQDASDRLLIPERLYGRGDEIATLMACFERVVNDGTPELALVSGHAGIGKSAVVSELCRVLVPERSLLAAGKFDQYKRDIPYATLAEAFCGLMRTLLGMCDTDLRHWRDGITDALGPNAALMTDLVPELKLIIGEPPPVPDLSPKAAQRRFQSVLRRFIGVFARQGRPLVLLIEDLQWLDAATLDLLEELLVQPGLSHLMLIGSYRDNEVGAVHPFMRKLEAIKADGGKVTEIALAPLGIGHLQQLTADALHGEPAPTASLAQLVHRKTGGNPYFFIQFLSSLADEGLLVFDQGEACWCWNLEHIRTKGYTNNVVDLMVAKLARLPNEARQALQQLACLGNSAQAATLALILEMPRAQVLRVLEPALRAELVECRADTYRFAHDRIQEAAYSRIAEGDRDGMHLRVGRLLAKHMPAGKRDEAIFEIVNHLNRAIGLITSQAERDQLAGFNLTAGKRAKAATAYASALTYLAAGVSLVGDDGWERQRGLIFELRLHQSECEFLTGSLVAADEHLALLAARAANAAEHAAVTCLRIDVCVTRDENAGAVAVALQCLERLGIDWSPQPAQEEARREYERIWLLLAGRSIESLVDLPVMSDATSLAIADVLAKLSAPAYYSSPNLGCLVICRFVNLSLECGNADASAYAYACLGVIAGSGFGDYASSYRFGRLSHELVGKRGLRRDDARTSITFVGASLPWKQPIGDGREILLQALDAADQSGDPSGAAHGCSYLNTNMLAAGLPLEQVQDQAERGLAFAQKAQYGAMVDGIHAQLGLVRTLRGLTPTFGCLDDADFSEERIERRFAANPDLAIAECWYWIRKLQARFFAGEYGAAVDAAARAQQVLWASPSFEVAEYHFYGALVRAACVGSATANERQAYLDALAGHQQQLNTWAELCPHNFADRAALVSAEMARIEGRLLDAELLYEQAIRAAHSSGFVHNEALANELAARFHAARGLEKIARVYAQDAHDAYVRWGAHGKARQIERYRTGRKLDADAAGSSIIAETPVEQLDLATVLGVSQVVSGEMVRENLIEALMRIAVEHAGAQRGVLVLSRGGELWIEAQADTVGDTVAIALQELPVSGADVPESILRYCARTQDIVILDDASAGGAFINDAYIRRVRARAVLCLPLVKQGGLVALLYLENHLAAGAFTPARIAVLKLLASQAAMALENARLYRDLASREAKIRRLVDANIVGIFIGDIRGRIFEANDAFLRIVGYDRDDLRAGLLDWMALTPPEWLERDRRERVPLLGSTRTLPPYEKEFLRKDGGRVPVLMGSAMQDDGGTEGIAFVLDLSELKRAEAETRQMQLELVHANRVTTIGQLVASISHEIKQPITAITVGASAGLRWLDREPPCVGEARQAMEHVVRDGKRAGEVIARIHGLVKKASTGNDLVQVGDTISEVMALTSGEASRSGVSTYMELADALPATRGDRVQLQQVMLNLIINAIDAMSTSVERPRELTVSATLRDAGMILVRVRDSGPGIPAESLGRLFEPFYTTKSRGMGMGLSICRSIVEAHGGRLWVGENTPAGAVFHFTVPVRSMDSA